ncbi:Mt ATP-synt D domain containing protein [Trichuris trichiura]|uniref:Mt ATP-synt D domain containing protein n=1 Tax=Trichuris trichiura TaxID=36087 RepID=A0A077ZFF0_TRITR|nr:Mt ATP-synt D domain containing protein [Trichuris trichiura]
MAARRVARSAIDWAKYSKIVMEHDRQQFENFRSLCQQPLLSISALPEKLPDIDWNYYKEKIAGFYNISEFETKVCSFEVE